MVFIKTVFESILATTTSMLNKQETVGVESTQQFKINWKINWKMYVNALNSVFKVFCRF